MNAAPQAGSSNKFWTLCRIAPGTHGPGYQNQSIPAAQAFFQQAAAPQTAAPQTAAPQTNSQTSDSRQTPTPLPPKPQPNELPKESTSHQALAIALFTTFRSDEAETALRQRALAGLCLRCWVSHPILQACIKLANLFGAAGQFSYRDLLPFVLTDDGRQQVLPDAENKAYHSLQAAGTLAPLSYTPFSLDVLRTYKPKADRPLSLVNWVYFQTKQHPELTTYLAEFGFQKLSDWALLNRVRPRQLEQLSTRDQALVQAFHAVYRRDRRLNCRLKGHTPNTHSKPSSGRCPNPTAAQLQEMNILLSQQASPSETALLQALKQVAVQLRQFDVWRSRQPLEHFDGTTGQYQPRSDLPTTTLETTTLETDASEETEMLAELHQQLAAALKTSLHEVLTARIAKLKKSKKYGPFASKFVIGLQHYYQEGLSLKEIAPLLGMSSWDQARRILNPGDFLNRVRSHTFQHFSTQVLTTIEQKALIPWPPTPAYLQTLSEQLEAFADAEIFQAATAEMKAGSHRNLDSAYAQQLLLTLEAFSSTLQPSTTHASGAR